MGNIPSSNESDLKENKKIAVRYNNIIFFMLNFVVDN
tara:strand:- start:5845 stop:5955 length:111 start_codon:yes stop_codon:yes gene_type:complete